MRLIRDISLARARRVSASAGGNPRSAKMLPSGGVTCVTTRLALPVFDDLRVATPREVEIPLCRFLRPLLERVEDVYGLCEPRDVEDAVLSVRADADLIHATSDSRHRLEVVRVAAEL